VNSKAGCIGINASLFAVLGFAIYKAFELSREEWSGSGFCPAIGFVPACYLVLAGFTMALIGHILNWRYQELKLFVVGLGIPTVLAMMGTVGQILGFIECPKTSDGIPMCFISLSLCSFCWLLWFVARKTCDKLDCKWDLEKICYRSGRYLLCHILQRCFMHFRNAFLARWCIVVWEFSGGFKFLSETSRPLQRT